MIPVIETIRKVVNYKRTYIALPQCCIALFEIKALLEIGTFTIDCPQTLFSVHLCKLLSEFNHNIKLFFQNKSNSNCSTLVTMLELIDVPCIPKINFFKEYNLR
jgi:hypothetical protein